MNWDLAVDEIRNLRQFKYLSNAIGEIDPDLTKILKIGTMRHPLTGLYFVARAPSEVNCVPFKIKDVTRAD